MERPALRMPSFHFLAKSQPVGMEMTKKASPGSNGSVAVRTWEKRND